MSKLTRLTNSTFCVLCVRMNHSEAHLMVSLGNVDAKVLRTSAVVDTTFVDIYVDTKNIPTCRYDIQHIDKRTREK